MTGRFLPPKDTCCLGKSRKHAARKWSTRNTLTSARSTRASSPDISVEIGGPAPNDSWSVRNRSGCERTDGWTKEASGGSFAYTTKETTEDEGRRRERFGNHSV